MQKIDITLAVGLLLLVKTVVAQNNTPLVTFNQHVNPTNAKNRVDAFLNAEKWNVLFPNRYGIGLKDTVGGYADFYSFATFKKAAQLFPTFLAEGDELTRKRELAAFLANIAQETCGGWADAPGGYFKWGLYYVNENKKGQNLAYADTSKKKYLPVSGQLYYGRGPKQISWNYNYGQFSEAWFGVKDSLLQNPSLLATNPLLSFASAIWFWVTPQYPKPSCHNIMVGKWKPSKSDIEKGRLPGFGATVNVINGGLECGSNTDKQKTVDRYNFYLFFCSYFGVNPGENIGCKTQKPFGQ